MASFDENLNIDLSDVFEDLEEDAFEDHNMPVASVSDKKNVITEDLVNKVILEIKKDILLPKEIKQPLESISAAHLVPALKQIDTIIKTEVFSGAAKEKAWHNFHLLQPDVMQKLSSIVISKQLSAFISLKTAEEIIRQNTPSSSSGKFNTGNVLKTGERNIVAYIAGFVLFRCKQKLASSFEIKKYLNKLTDTDGNTKLISIKSRGGLTQPSLEAVNIFVVLELVFRNSCTSVSVPTLQQFTNTICLENEVVSMFYDCTYHSESNAEVQEKLFFSILSIFHRVRCHARCRQLMENFYSKTKSVSKQKALRKCID